MYDTTFVRDLSWMIHYFKVYPQDTAQEYKIWVFIRDMKDAVIV